MRRIAIHAILFVLTVASTLYVGGPGYSVTIMLILLGHELGHYFMSRHYGMRATLPFFLPFPFSPFGTLGAVIRMESHLASRRSLFDTGVAGPLVGLCLSIPAIAVGLRLSQVVPASHVKDGVLRLSDPLLFSLIQLLVLGKIPESADILLHPIGYAGWVGLFVTSLNLLPVGQLDGGHVAYALFGRKSRVIFFATIGAMSFITFFYNPGWLLLLILIVVFGLRHPTPSDDYTPLDPGRKVLGGLTFVAFFLSFTPAPFPEIVESFRDLIPWF